MPVRAGRDDTAPITPPTTASGSSGLPAELPQGRQAHPSCQSSRGAGGTDRAGKGGLTLLVIEDDLTGSRSVPDMLDAAGGYLPEGPVPGLAGGRVRVRTARNLTEAERLLTDDVQCILLDLALTGGPPGTSGAATATSTGTSTGAVPSTATTVTTAGTATTAQDASIAAESGGREADPQPGGPAGSPAAAAQAGPAAEGAEPSDELEILRRVLRMAPRHAVLALTDGADAERAAAAVRVGAQDYLFRDELDGRLLTRAIRYAVERKRADLAQHKLAESRLRAQENARLERGLLPTPLLAGSELRFAARYRPGRSRALLGGDFYDTVRTADGTVHAMIGDVCGHGPDEAALGVELRIAWRALTFAGLCGDQLLGTLQKVLEHERRSEEIFATLCTVDISPDARSAGVCLAGHPSPLVAGGGGSAPRLLPYDESGTALGVLSTARWPRRQVELGRAWSLLMYTDGLIEGRIDGGEGRLGQEGMVGIVASRMAQGERGESLLDATMEDVRQLNGGELTDDVAVLLLGRG